MSTSESETYLGDVICVSGSNKKNIENRRDQAIWSVSQIMTMIDQMPHYYFEIRLVLRESMLVSKLVSSFEVWYIREKLKLYKNKQKCQRCITLFYKLGVTFWTPEMKSSPSKLKDPGTSLYNCGAANCFLLGFIWIYE